MKELLTSLLIMIKKILHIISYAEIFWIHGKLFMRMVILPRQLSTEI